MKKCNISGLSVMLVFAFLIPLTNPTFAQKEQFQDLEGNIVCLEVDKEGNINTIEEFSVCNGLLVFVSQNGKVYSVHGSEEIIQSIAKSHEKKIETMDLAAYIEQHMISGRVEGNQRAWRLYASSSLEPKELQKSEERTTITGTIVCLIPDYGKGSVKPLVAIGPCNELEPHAHVVYTSDGQIYALHGSEEAIRNIEKSRERGNLSLKGKVKGIQNAWILFVE